MKVYQLRFDVSKEQFQEISDHFLVLLDSFIFVQNLCSSLQFTSEFVHLSIIVYVVGRCL
jgi:hypothetical protein